MFDLPLFSYALESFSAIPLYDHYYSVYSLVVVCILARLFGLLFCSFMSSAFTNTHQRCTRKEYSLCSQKKKKTLNVIFPTNFQPCNLVDFEATSAKIQTQKLMENKKDLEYHDVQSPEHFEVQTT